MRLIDADAMRQDWLENGENEYVYDANAVLDSIDAQPTVDAVPVVHGHWVRLDAHKGIEQFKCSVCRSECYVPTCMNEPMFDYCPYCGALMDGERRSGDE